MFLFKIYQYGKYKYILHTGDFRASDELIRDVMLKNIKIDTVYLDTTYCDSYYRFLPQTKAISLGAEFCFKELVKYPKALFVCGSYSVGKERVFLGNIFI
jgi:DNA cross-link repair 1A protein